MDEDYLYDPEWHAHLDAIRAAPDDDLPREILADWLDERCPERAEFIRLELQWEEDSRGAWTDRMRECMERSQKLLESPVFGCGWTLPEDSGGEDIGQNWSANQRGFVEWQWTGTFEEWTRGDFGIGLLRHQPMTGGVRLRRTGFSPVRGSRIVWEGGVSHVASRREVYHVRREPYWRWQFGVRHGVGFLVSDGAFDTEDAAREDLERACWEWALEGSRKARPPKPVEPMWRINADSTGLLYGGAVLSRAEWQVLDDAILAAGRPNLQNIRRIRDSAEADLTPEELARYPDADDHSDPLPPPTTGIFPPV
jgi:uncharacterized protein (TIGR02996 family)